jgi:multiple sugar transport system permease protein
MHTSYRRGLLWMLTPYLLGAFALVLVPALMAGVIAFFRYDGLSPARFAGWQNFIEIFNEPLLKISLNNSLVFVLLSVPLRLGLALALALLYRRHSMRFYRAAAYLPTAIPEVALALAFLWILNPLYGPLNGLLAALGLSTPGWLVEPLLAKPALVFMTLFTIGEGFLILLAGLRNIPPELDEAAWMDGAGRWQALRYVTLPLLAPWLVLLTVRDVILSFQASFTAAYLMTGGGPYYSTLFLPLLVYEEAFDRLRFGQGAAMMLILLAVTIVLVLLAYFLYEDGWRDDEA